MYWFWYKCTQSIPKVTKTQRLREDSNHRAPRGIKKEYPSSALNPSVTISFCCLKMIAWSLLLRENHMPWSFYWETYSILCQTIYCNIENNMRGPRLACVGVELPQTMLATYRYTCWANKQSKNLCSIESTCPMSWQGQSLSTLFSHLAIV